MDYVKAFAVGGLLCAVGQILIDKTKLTPARILISYLIAGFVLSVFGLYKPFVEWAGAGATVPLSGFGHVVAEGMRKAVAEKGALGVITGGMIAMAGGVGAAALFAFIAGIFARSKTKS